MERESTLNTLFSYYFSANLLSNSSFRATISNGNFKNIRNKRCKSLISKGGQFTVRKLIVYHVVE